MSKVADQYNEWVYPIPIEDMRTSIAEGGYWEIGDPLLYYPLFWPRKRNVDHLDILIAGCGSVQAAYYACRNPNWNVIGVDLSDSSLSHQKKLKELHGLKNLQVQKLDLTKVSELGQDFDFIVSTGVLHHLTDPDAGLSALKEVLRPEGVMNLMVYGKSLRLGVYMMQEVFRALNFKQTQEDVDCVKATLDILPSDHVLRRYMKYAPDLHYDAAFVDTFLHSQDRAYTVNEVYNFTRSSGLEFLTWCDPAEYTLESIIPPGHPLWQKLDNQDPQTLAHICDLMTQSRGTHRWAAAHPAYVESVQIPFTSDDFFDCTVLPHRQTKLLRRGDITTGESSVCQRGNLTYEIDIRLADVIDMAKGIHSIREVVNDLSISNKLKLALLTAAREQFQKLWKLGHLYIFLPERTHASLPHGLG